MTEPEVYRGEHGPELIHYLDEALKLQNNTLNAKARMLNEAVLDVGVTFVENLKAFALNKFTRTLPGQKPIYWQEIKPIELYQPKPAYESMMLNAGYDAELRLE